MAVSPDGERVVFGLVSGGIDVCDTRTGTRLYSIAGKTPYPVSGVAVTHDGRRLVSMSGGNTICVYDLETGTEQLDLADDYGHVFAITPGGDFVVVGGRERCLWVRSLVDGTQKNIIGGSALVRSLAVSPDGRYIAGGCTDSTTRVWSFEDGTLVMEFKSDTLAAFNCIMFTPDGSGIVTGSSTGTVTLWSLDSGECRWSMSIGHHPVASLAISPSGSHLVTGGGTTPYYGLCLLSSSGGGMACTLPDECREHKVSLWSMEDGGFVRHLDSHSSDVHSVAVSPDGNSVLSASTTSLQGKSPSCLRNIL